MRNELEIEFQLAEMFGLRDTWHQHTRLETRPEAETDPRITTSSATTDRLPFAPDVGDLQTKIPAATDATMSTQGANDRRSTIGSGLEVVGAK